MSKELNVLVKEFFGNYSAKRFQKREILLRPEQELTSIFYLEEGMVAQYDISPSGNEVIVNVFKPGAFFPMSQALNKNPNKYYFFETIMPVIIRPAPIDEVISFLEVHPEVTLDLLKRVYRGTDGLLRRMAHLMGGSAKSRLIFELLNAGYRFGKQSSGGRTAIPLTEGDLAKRSGLSRETVSRTMRELKTTSIVSVNPNGIVISDLAELEALLGSSL